MTISTTLSLRIRIEGNDQPGNIVAHCFVGHPGDWDSVLLVRQLVLNHPALPLLVSHCSGFLDWLLDRLRDGPLAAVHLGLVEAVLHVFAAGRNDLLVSPVEPLGDGLAGGLASGLGVVEAFHDGNLHSITSH